MGSLLLCALQGGAQWSGSDMLPVSACAFANVRIKRLLANIGFPWSFGFYIRLTAL
jgi:hypothetical protein